MNIFMPVFNVLGYRVILDTYNWDPKVEERPTVYVEDNSGLLVTTGTYGGPKERLCLRKRLPAKEILAIRQGCEDALDYFRDINESSPYLA